MLIGTNELASARDTARELLDEIGLEAYLFEIEPREDRWELRLECAAPGGWDTLTLAFAPDLLQQCRSDAATRARTLETWRTALSACRHG